MVKVTLEGWREGLNKVSLTKLQMGMLNMKIKESKLNVDLLLDDKKVILEIDDKTIAEEFVRKAEEMGVKCKITKD
jgi:hypothetical protein